MIAAGGATRARAGGIAIHPVVEVFADVVCPFAHVGLRRFVGRRAELGLEAPVLRVRAWPLELVNARPFDAQQVAQHVAELRDTVAADLFTRFTPLAVPSTSLPAFALAAQAYATGDRAGEAVSLALRAALFDEGRNVADPDVLAEIAARFGLGETSVAPQHAYETDYAEGRRRGVQGSPHFYVGDRDFFCPALRIDRRDDELTIIPRPERIDALLDECFPLREG